MRKRWPGVLLVLMAVAWRPHPALPSPVDPHDVARSPGQVTEPVCVNGKDLNVLGIHVGMTREQVRLLHIPQDQWPREIAYDAQGRVCFVVGTALLRGDVVITSGPLSDLRWSGLVARGPVGAEMVACYRADPVLVVMRYRPPAVAARVGGVAEFGVAQTVASLPEAWGHAMIQAALPPPLSSRP